MKWNGGVVKKRNGKKLERERDDHWSYLINLQLMVQTIRMLNWMSHCGRNWGILRISLIRNMQILAGNWECEIWLSLVWDFRSVMFLFFSPLINLQLLRFNLLAFRHTKHINTISSTMYDIHVCDRGKLFFTSRNI